MVYLFALLCGFLQLFLILDYFSMLIATTRDIKTQISKKKSGEPITCLLLSTVFQWFISNISVYYVASIIYGWCLIKLIWLTPTDIKTQIAKNKIDAGISVNNPKAWKASLQCKQNKVRLTQKKRRRCTKKYSR